MIAKPTAEIVADHWADDPDHAERVRATYRNLPPNTWEAFVWRDLGRGDSVEGVIDSADAHRLISVILMAQPVWKVAP